MRRNSSEDSIFGINSYLDKEVPPPPYEDHSNSTMVTTTTTTTTVTTVTTTTISNSGDSTSKQQIDMNSLNNNNNTTDNVKPQPPNVVVVSYESSCATNNNDTEKFPENSNSSNLLVPDDFKKHKRSGSAPSVPVVSFKEQAENKYKNNTVPSAQSMVNLVDSGRNTVLLNKSYKETPQQYLEKLRDTLSKSELATLLTKSKDVFHETVLRTYMETFEFINDPIDIALR
jgi:hypothetical protein